VRWVRTITVTGQGTAHAAPDAAEVRVAAVHRDTGLSEALAGAESARAEVVATARRYVEAAQIASTDLNVWPSHDNDGRPTGFEARHSMSIRCDDLAQAGSLVTALAADVGHRLQVETVVLVVADPAEARVEARERAFADARSRARHLAGMAGAALGDVQSITEEGATSVARSFAADAAYASKLEVSFEPGLHAVAVALTVTFELV
jgi:hypothetical protein